MSTHKCATAKKSSPIPSLTPVTRNLLQRTCECGGSSKLAGGCEGCNKKRELKGTEHSIPPLVHEVLRSPGQPLDSRTRAFMEPHFGHDFSKVRIHADEKAGASARAVQSLAYTVGNNLVFGPGQYSPMTAEGTKLIAHELTHVVQQGEHGTAMQGSLTIGHPHDRYEQEADRMAAFLAGIGTTEERRIPTISALQGNNIQRSCASCSAVADYEDEKPEHKGFTYEDLMAGEVKEEEEPEMLGAGPQKTSLKADSRSPGKESSMLPHFVSATITCESGDYVVKLNDWGGKPCGISDCVTVHEKSHIDDWRGRWPKGCKKADGSNQPDGYLPTGGDGYDEFLKKSECTAHTKDLNCAEAKVKKATGDCKTKLENYAKLTKDQKAGYC